MEDLDNLLADLEKATQHLRDNSTDYPVKMSAGPKTTQTKISKLTREYTITSKGGPIPDEITEPLYENSQMVNANRTNEHEYVNSRSQSNYNLSELDNLLEDLNSARNLPSSETNGYQSKSITSNRSLSQRKDSTQVNRLISDLEYDLHHPSDKHGQEIKPIIMTKYQFENSSGSAQSSTVTKSPQHALYSTPRPMSSNLDREPPAREAPAASNATRELDDLMASLSDFKVKERVNEYEKATAAQAAPSKPSQPQPLDSMIGNLQSDMSKHGIDTAAKGHCCACHKPIVGQVVTALGRTWHPEHFTCVHCRTELGSKNFFERGNEPYCETDYHDLFSPKCAYCNTSIIDKCVTALDKTWHPEHFFCAHCGKQEIADEGFHEKDGKPYCTADYFDLFAPKCGACNMPITDDYISALNNVWHPDCFVCRDCKCPFLGGSFFDHEGQPYCETHYHAKRGSLCAGCLKPITGRCITAMFRKFHPEHFVCSFCLKQLNKGTFKEQNDKPYCHACFGKLFG
ncbi:paxillin [Brevipalpus obovatus]|uniref:paxillin n=1 Tax=Brevipalpus obovatus TaxID=246614 RepID=UPI003D9F0BCD